MKNSLFTGIRGVIFDLDGVIVDTAKYHYLAWKRLAAELGFAFREEENERLKGVSRMESLDILLQAGGLVFGPQEKQTLADRKNRFYTDYIAGLTPSALLPGAVELIESLRKSGCKTSIGSASKNTRAILDLLEITRLFDAVVDGNRVSKAKPDPEVFLIAAREMGVPPSLCMVLEDSAAGIRAAKAAGMTAVGVGNAEVLREADGVVWSLFELKPVGIAPYTGSTLTGL